MTKVFIILFSFTLMLIQHTGFGKDIIVTEGMSIKDAVESSSAGDKIIVKQGTYYESGIIITKKIELTGENYPVIDGGSRGEIITVRADGVIIKGLRIQNTGFSSMKDNAAIKIENSKDCLIQSNKLTNNYFGIYLAGSNKCTVLYNEVMSNAVTESSSGNGIHLWKCDSISIRNNFVSGHRDGIYFEFVTGSRIENNSSYKNIRYGLHFMFSNGDDYENNVFSENGAGVAVMYTKNVKMINNRFENNWGPSAYGLLLKDITDSYIYSNKFHKNTIGIYSEGVTRVNITGNSFTENGYALKILGNCAEDTVKQNNFTSNTFDVATNSSKNVNVFTGNYWDKYGGYDLDKDGIGDVQYRPVSMFSMIVEETPEALFLLRSFVVDLLDIAEKVAPVFIPETLVDDKPRMEEIQQTSPPESLNILRDN